MIRSLADFAPPGVEAGVGLALQDEAGRYLFFLAGARHRCPPGELFFAGIGGHLEPGETWHECARREALEETGADLELLPADQTWHVRADGSVTAVDLAGEHPRPLALYEMVHQPGSPRAGQLYRIVIYRARFTEAPREIPPDEVGGIIALTGVQVSRALRRKPTLAQLIAEGGALVAGAVDLQTMLHPVGTAAALAHIMQMVGPGEDRVATVGVYLQVDGRFPFVIGPNPAGDQIAVVRIGGHREDGEEPWACARREALEETDLEIEPLDPPGTFFYHRTDAEPRFEPHAWPEHPAPLLLLPRDRSEHAPVNLMYLARGTGTPRPSSETKGLLLLTPAEVQLLCREKLTLRQFRALGGMVAIQHPMNEDLPLVPALQLQLLARLLETGLLKGDP